MSFRGAPLECVACHRKDDTHKGRYGEKCGTCHTAVSWKRHRLPPRPRHEVPAGRAHATTKCDACHVGNVYKDKLSSDCYACHRKDDKHRDQLGRQCEQCHDTEDWKKTVRFDHAKSRFPLLGTSPAQAECKACHVTPAFKDARRECVACHVKDDQHKRTARRRMRRLPQRARLEDLGLRSHAKRTRYPLDGAHAKVACVACHKMPGEKIPALAT